MVDLLPTVKNALASAAAATVLVLGACKPAPKPAPPQPAPTPTPVSSIARTLDKLKAQTERAMDQTKERLEDLAKRFEGEREFYARDFER